MTNIVGFVDYIGVSGNRFSMLVLFGRGHVPCCFNPAGMFFSDKNIPLFPENRISVKSPSIRRPIPQFHDRRNHRASNVGGGVILIFVGQLSFTCEE